MKPAWDGIAAWILIAVGLLVGLSSPRVDGRTVLSLALVIIGTALASNVASRAEQ